MTRVINLCLNADEVTELAETAGYTQLMAAIAYLSTWNIATFPGVTITRDRMDTSDLFALYYDPSNPERRYAMGAVWHDDHYGFHS